jgi:hypothetical protein
LLVFVLFCFFFFLRCALLAMEVIPSILAVGGCLAAVPFLWKAAQWVQGRVRRKRHLSQR